MLLSLVHRLKSTLNLLSTLFCTLWLLQLMRFLSRLAWQDLLIRYVRGNGALWDLEYLTDDKGRRLTSYGPIAGMMGVAAGALAWARQKVSRLGFVMPEDMLAKLENLPLVDCTTISWTSQTFSFRFSLLFLSSIPLLSLLPSLLAFGSHCFCCSDVKALIQSAVVVSGRRPRVIVIGAAGRVGTGAVQFAANQLGRALFIELFSLGVCGDEENLFFPSCCNKTTDNGYFHGN